MMHEDLIRQVYDEVKKRFAGMAADHDFDHIERVYKMAMHLQSKEGGDAGVIACAALLHDISDHKLNGGKLNEGGKVAAGILLEMGETETFARQVAGIIDQVSFKGAGVPDQSLNIELQIVRDADRLDAMGAIGIARAFHYGGHRNRPLYLPDVAPVLHTSFEAYAADKGHTMNHFHEKLLLLKDRLQTKTARQIGEDRHAFMLDFVHRFYAEWETDQ